MKLQLIPATQADFEYARDIHHTAYRDMVIRQFGQWEKPVQDRFFIKTWNQQKFEIITVEDEPCGFCSLEESDEAIQLREFAVEVSKQGMGIGSQLLTLLKRMGMQQGKIVLINVMKSNDKAKRLYERHGFSVYGENNSQFLMQFPPAKLTVHERHPDP